MALLNKSLIALVNGVSRQPFQSRLDSQGEDQDNCFSSVSRGLLRRPGSQYKFALNGSINPNGFGAAGFHFIDRDSSEQYVVVTDGEGALEVWDLISQTQKTVNAAAGASTYLDVNSDFTKLRFLTIADTTYVLNRTKTAAKTSTVGSIGKHYAMLWVRQGMQDGLFSVDIDNRGTTGKQTSTFTSVDASAGLRTNGIAFGIKSAIDVKFAGVPGTVADPLPVVEEVGEYLIIYMNDGAGGFPNFDISVSDPLGGGALKVFKYGGEVQKFSDLPASAPNDFYVEVSNTPDDDADNYFVHFQVKDDRSNNSVGPDSVDFGHGVWKETVKEGLTNDLDPDTLPWKLVRNAMGEFDLDPVSWVSRKYGDTKSAADPSFIGQEIEDLVFHKDRLGFVAGENVVFSAVGEYETFYPTTVATLPDDDPIDIEANFENVAKFRHAISFQEDVVLFGDGGIYVLRGSPDGFTHTTVYLQQAAEFSGTMTVPPVLSGDRIFFAEQRPNHTVFREFYKADDTGDYTAEPITEHVRDYLPGNLAFSASSASNNILLVHMEAFSNAVQSADLYVYQWFFSDRRKVQSAWHRWTLDSPRLDAAGPPNPEYGIAAAAVLRNTVYMIVSHAGFSDFHVVAMDLEETEDFVLLYHPRIDFRQAVTGTFLNPNTRFVIKPSLANHFDGSNYDDLVVILSSSSWGANQGDVLVPVSVTDQAGDQTWIEVVGDYSGHQVEIGARYRSSYTFSPPTAVSPQDRPLLNGRTFLKRLQVEFLDPVTLTTETGSRTAVRYTMKHTDKSRFSFPIQRENRDVRVTMYSKEHDRNFQLVGADWEIEHNSRGRPF
jgi:hypothetical protein